MHSENAFREPCNLCNDDYKGKDRDHKTYFDRLNTKFRNVKTVELVALSFPPFPHVES